MNSIDLCVPIYLNQQIVFDLLAVLEDGFSTMSTIKTSDTESINQCDKVGGSIGASNVFAFLGISIGGSQEHEKEMKGQTDISKERIHTPTSLFAKLRLTLNENKLLINLKTPDDLNQLSCGQFLEMRVKLKKNPLVDTIEAITELMEMAVLIEDMKGLEVPIEPSQKALQKDQKSKNKIITHHNPNKLLLDKINAMLNALTQSNSLELVGELLDAPNVKAVLSTRIDYFNNRDASEIIDGEFRVIGKIIRIIDKNSSESINLLRKTTFGRLDLRVFEGFKNIALNSQNQGIKLPDFISEVPGPAIQIIPIAIFT
jgi:hypothetical protein